ncbi:hypothetical protein ACOME3_005424 [Neoechinorhynchus agilis]
MPRPVDAAMIQFDATSHDSQTTYSDHSNTEETPNVKGKPGLNSVHQITTLRQAISFARQTHDPYPMPRPVDAAMIQFDATSHDSPITYSDHSNTEETPNAKGKPGLNSVHQITTLRQAILFETPNAKGKPGLNSVHQITTLRQAISFARQKRDPYPMPRPVDAAMIQFDATSHESPTTYSDHSNTEETPNAKGKPGLNSVHQITTLRQAISFARQTNDPYPMPRPVDAAMIQFDATSHDSPITYSDHSNTEETPNATGKPGHSKVCLDSFSITKLGWGLRIKWARQITSWGTGQIPQSLKPATPENPSTPPGDAGSLPSAADLVRVRKIRSPPGHDSFLSPDLYFPLATVRKSLSLR